MAVKHYFGALLVLVVLSSSIYFMLPGEVRIDIEKTRTKYSVYENGSFVLAATEYVNLYDGTTKMRAKSREISWNVDSNFVYAVRTSKWKDNITTIQTYKFDQDTIDVRDFPSKNTLECINCEGKIVHYEIRDILYHGETKVINSPFSFGHNMKIEWQEGAYFSKVYQQKISDKIIIKYRPESSYESYDVRLFDPPPSRISINSLEPQWNVIKRTGNEENLTLWTANSKDKKTEIGFVVRENMTYNTIDKLLYDENNEKILDDKDKNITLKYESSKCDGQDCYYISLTNAQAVNINDYVKLGEESLVVVYEETKEILFSISDTKNISAKLYWDINGDKSDWSNSINELFVFFSKDKWKFGAYHNDSVWERYKYVLESNAIIEKRGNFYYFRDGLGGYKFDPSDICNKINNNTNETSDCKFNQYSIFYNENITINFLEIIFYSDSEIDPTFIFENLESESILNNIRLEGDGSTHISINNSGVVLYMPFDVNVSQTTIYDYSNNDNDGSLDNGAFIGTNGVYGNSLELDGIDDEVTVANSDSINTLNTEITISAWVKWDGMPDGYEPYARKGPSGGSSRDFDLGPAGNNFFGQFSDGITSRDLFVSNYQNFIPHGSWGHIVFVGNSSGAFLYMNNVLRDENTDGFGIYNKTTNDIEIGFRGSDKLHGSIDELIIYNRALSASEVSDIYNNQSAKFFSSGKQTWNNSDISADSPTLANFTLDDSFNLLGSNFAIQLDSEEIVNFTDGFVSDYDLTGVSDLSDVNISLWYYTSPGKFYTPINLGNITIDTFGEGPPVDTCTYTSGDWNIDCSDNCVINSPVTIDGDLNLQGTGLVRLLSILSFNSTNQFINQYSGCIFDVESGGEINGN